MRGIHAEERREDERSANGLRRKSKAALNRRYISGRSISLTVGCIRGGESGQHRGHDAELYDFARPSFTGEVVTAEQIAPFPRGDEYLKALWQNEAAPRTAFRIVPDKSDENDPVIKKLWRILRVGDSNRSPGYDQITYRTLRQCEKILLIMWLILTFSLQTKLGLSTRPTN